MEADKIHAQDADVPAAAGVPHADDVPEGTTIGPGPEGSRLAELFIFNTDVRLYAYPADDEDPHDPALAARHDAALAAACARCGYFERIFSRTRPDSDIARAHAVAPEPVPVAPETAELVRLALAYGAASGGAFDITMGTLTSLWDFHRGIVPSTLALARAKEHVGAAGRIVVGADAAGPTLAITDPATILDLGGIAKGYIADDLARLLRERGVGRFVLNLGGNVLVEGGRPVDPAGHRALQGAGHRGWGASADDGGAAGAPVLGAAAGAPGDAPAAAAPITAAPASAAPTPLRPWRIGIVNPLDPAHHRAIVELAAGSVVTSGIHERSFIKGGVRYHHILDPATGMPAATDVTSATIVARRSIDCDGWSTTAFMLGADRALARIEELPGIEAVLITDRDEVRWTSGIADALSLIPTLPRW